MWGQTLRLMHQSERGNESRIWFETIEKIWTTPNKQARDHAGILKVISRKHGNHLNVIGRRNMPLGKYARSTTIVPPKLSAHGLLTSIAVELSLKAYAYSLLAIGIRTERAY